MCCMNGGERLLTCEERGSRESENTSKEISRPSISSCGRSRVWSVSANHVIDGSHVDGVVGDTDDTGKDRGSDPVDRATANHSGAGPCEADETNWETRSKPQKPVETRFELSSFIVRFGLTFSNVGLDGWNEACVCNEVTDENWEEGETHFYGSEAPLSVDETE